MSERVRLCVAKDAVFGAYGNVSGWNLFVERGDSGAILDSKCIEDSGNRLVFEVDSDALTADIGKEHAPTISKDGTTVREMVRQFLDDNGYDGLCNPDAECGCSKDDLFPCGEHQGGDCVCAYAGNPPGGEDADYGSWFYVNEGDAR